MRLAWFSPLPPIGSGIGDYSFELLPLIAEHANVDVFCPSPARGRLMVPGGGVEVLPPEAFPDRAGRYDAVFHHLGNNPHHDYVYEAARRRPDVAVFHDYVLHHLLAHDPWIPRNLRRYGAVLEQEFGHAGRLVVGLAREGMRSEMGKFLLPLNRTVARAARAIVVHSHDVAERFLEVAPGVPVTVIPHHAGEPPRTVSGVTRAEARSRLSLPPNSFVVGQFGFITGPKQPVAVLGGFSRLVSRFPDALLILVGENQAGPGLAHLISERRLDHSVRIVGHVDLDRLYMFLKATDAVVNLRYPSAGESSGIIARALAEGRPVIVNNVAAFAELPSDVALKIEVDGDQEAQVASHLLRLAEDSALRTSYETRARAYAKARLDPGRCAEEYVSLARRLMRSSSEV